jgi:uncharacterized protein YjdB
VRRLLLAAVVVAVSLLHSTGAFALSGDVTGDGVLDLRDPLALCRFLAGTIKSLPAPQNGDVNFDGVLNRADVDVLMRAMVGIPPPPPPLSVSPLTLDFGDVLVQADSILDITLKNNGAAPVSVDSIARGAGGSAAYSIVSAPQTPAILAPGGQAIVTVRYAPAMIGLDAGSVVILSAGGGATVTLKGRGVAALLSVAPSTLDFGSVLVGNDALLDVTVKNDGNIDLEVASIAPAPQTSADFSIQAAPSTPFTLHPGQMETITVRYAPAQSGPDAGGIEILTSGGPASVTLKGGGIAPALDVNPISLDFGNVLVSGSQGRSFAVNNTGSAPLEVTGVAFQVGSSADFSIAPLPPTPFTIAPGDAQSVDITYMPSGVGPDAGHVEIHTNAGDDVVDLTGAGVAPAIDVSPQSLDFMNVLVGQSATLPVEILNVGTADLTVSSIAFEAGGSADIRLQAPPTLPATIGPGTSVIVDVVYVPGQVGPAAATLKIVSDDPATPGVEVPISGNGVASGVMVHPNTLLFSNVRAGQTLDQDFTITNSGSVDLTVNSVSMKSGSSADFSLASPRQTPFTLAAGDAQAITVRYAPLTAGMDTGTVSLDTSAGAGQVDLTGSAIAPKISVTPPVHDFGSVKAGLQATVEITIANIGSDTLNVSGIDLTGSADFSLQGTPSLPLALAPGDSALLHAVYAPGQDGPDSGLITIASDDPGSPSAGVNLSGLGISPHLAVSPLSLDFADVSLNFSRTLPVTIRNTGTGDLTLSGIALDPNSSPAFAIVLPLPSPTVPAGGSTSFNVRYGPIVPGGDAGTLGIASDGGSASVTLSGNGVTGATVVSITLSPASPTLAVGDCVQIHAVALLTNATQFDVTSTATWSPLDPGIADVGATGLVTGVSPGTSAATATFAGVSSQTDLNVVDAGTLRISAPCGDVAAAASFTGEVTVNSGAAALGSYAVRVHYDPSVVRITAITGGTTPDFSSTPGFDPSSFASGSTLIAAFQNASLTEPSGTISLARITFEVIGAPGASAPLSLEAVTLAATDLTDIASTNVPVLVSVAP